MTKTKLIEAHIGKNMNITHNLLMLERPAQVGVVELQMERRKDGSIEMH